MLTGKLKIACGLAGAFLLALALPLGRLTAQQTGAAGSASGSAASADAAERAKILNSDQWKQIGTQYQQWLNTQPIYSPSQIKKINDQLDAQIQNMPTSELQGFMDDWQAKLKVLNGKDFQEAQNWLGAYMTNMAEGYRRNYLQQMGLTDIPSMSAGQLEEAITDIRANQMSIQQNQAAFNASRRQAVQNAQQQNAASIQAQQQQSNSYTSSAGFNTFQSPYRPPKFNPPPPPQMKFFIDNGPGQISYSLPL
ncbi:MAG TPA: hypothetical protein VMJ32_04210 [Pirellulales bacterium]|nr:hypothetical protein [Pirellulales bacterium]